MPPLPRLYSGIYLLYASSALYSGIYLLYASSALYSSIYLLYASSALPGDVTSRGPWYFRYQVLAPSVACPRFFLNGYFIPPHFETLKTSQKKIPLTVSHLPEIQTTAFRSARTISVHELKWQINGLFHPQAVKTIMRYKTMHVASSSTHLGASLSRSHLPQNIPALLSNKICPRTDGMIILPCRIATVSNVLPCGALKPNRRIGTQLRNRVQGTPK